MRNPRSSTLLETRKKLLLKLLLTQREELTAVGQKVLDKKEDPTEFYKLKRKVKETSEKLLELGFFKVCGCGKAYTEKEWRNLTQVGRSVVYDSSGAPVREEIRNCNCGSTLTAQTRTKNAEPKV